MRGDLSPQPEAPQHPGLVRGQVKRHTQHPETRQWTMTVELRGGRIVSGVHPTFPNSGVYSGSRPELPAIGSHVLVGFAESDITLDAFALACFDANVYGLDRDSPHESVSLHRSGLGQATSPDGTLTTRFPGGDELIAGPGAGYEFLARDTKGKTYTPKLPQRALRILLDATRGGLQLGARLVGGLEVLADAAKRTILLRATSKDSLSIKPGLMRAQTGSMVVGEEEEMAASVARWPEVKATLDALTKELQQVKHALVIERARNNRTDLQIEIITAFPVLLPIKIPVAAVPVIPLPFITPQGKDGAMQPLVGGVQVVEAGAKTLHAE